MDMDTTHNLPALHHLNTLLTTPHLHTLTTTLTFVIPLLSLLYIHADYKAFLSLGPGGTPSTPLGYLKIKLLSLVCLRNVHTPMPVPPHFRPSTGYLTTTSLPTRSGPRPLVCGIAPQRQQTQQAPQATYNELIRRLRALVADPANQLQERTSCFEKHSSGLFAQAPIVRTKGGEVCHAHPSDGSMHLMLHPADAKIMIESGWGERHPLARGGWCRRFVPREFVLVYAPRTAEEVGVVMEVVKAGIWWVAGIEVEKGVKDRRDSGLAVEGL